MACESKIIAIDGPAGSGKSTVAKKVAQELKFLYIDTGAMYRALTLYAVKENIDLNDDNALIALAKKADIQLKEQNGSPAVYLNGENVTEDIRLISITEKVYYIAKVQGVRAEMVKMQRRLGQTSKGAVLEGRDIGTVVFPDARYKFYLDAQEEERVRRRFKELKKMGQAVDEKALHQDIKRRDQSDMTRSAGPLVKAEDAVYIDTTGLNIAQVVEKIIEKCSTS